MATGDPDADNGTNLAAVLLVVVVFLLLVLIVLWMSGAFVTPLRPSP